LKREEKENAILFYISINSIALNHYPLEREKLPILSRERELVDVEAWGEGGFSRLPPPHGVFCDL